MANKEFSDTVLKIVEPYLRQFINTNIPAKVLNVSELSSRQVIDVQPLINNRLKDGRVIENPPIFDVPVIFPSAGGGILSFPIKVGNIVYLNFSMRGLDEFKESLDSDLLTPEDRRSFSLADAVAIPCIYSKNNNLTPNAEDVELKFVNSFIKIKANGDIEVNSVGNIIANAGGDIEATAVGQITLTAPTVTIQGDLVVNGDTSFVGSSVTHNSINIGDTHTHTQSNDSGGNTEQATDPPQ